MIRSPHDGAHLAPQAQSRDRVGGEGGFLENTIRMNLPKGGPLGFGEICVDFWDFERGAPEVVFLLLLI